MVGYFVGVRVPLFLPVFIQNYEGTLFISCHHGLRGTFSEACVLDYVQKENNMVSCESQVNSKYDIFLNVSFFAELSASVRSLAEATT